MNNTARNVHMWVLNGHAFLGPIGKYHTEHLWCCMGREAYPHNGYIFLSSYECSSHRLLRV